ncbi:hypothetical protein Nepgr_003031 [Nepenthes gracilis]|uniref:Ubiquitin-like protease family profile domain-containing protein n=1 Tax=Nepenthes gracilis TaxID=150966 RepID=A0AAD3RYT0_NEPGR|nr:hypothetical protein Nepgr_003031 [Nepenthes gracilis]
MGKKKPSSVHHKVRHSASLHEQKNAAAEEVVELKKRSKHTSPCFLDPNPSLEHVNQAKSRTSLAIQKKLDSGTFELHFENLWRSFSAERKTSFTHLDSLWFSLYLKEDSREKVLSWIKREHIFSKKYVLIPIVCWGHWSLLIFCHFGENLLSKSKRPCMLLLDSLEMANPRRLEPYIRKFVLDIYRAYGITDAEDVIFQIPLLVPKVPQQKNEECGSFVLYFINLFMKTAPETFSISEGYPYFMNQDWFTRESFELFCSKLETQSSMHAN